MARNEVEKFVMEYDEKFGEEHSSEIAALSQEQRQFFNHVVKDHYHYSYEEHYPVKIKQKKIDCLSDFVRRNYGRAVSLLVPEEFTDDYYYMLDNLNKYQYSQSWSRRSFRCSDYLPYVERIFALAYSYYLLGAINYGIDDMEKFVLRNDDGICRDVQERFVNSHDYIIAARIDAGDSKVIDIIKQMMMSENNTAILSVYVIRGVVLSSDTELHDLLCKLLIAAKLSEGLRQAICENADCGTAECFIKIARTIKENNFVRFASVKRAIGTWTGLCQYENPDRLAGKIVDDIDYVLESREHALEYIDTTDAVHIYMGLWGLGFYDVQDACDVVLELTGVKDGFSTSGNMVQLLTIGYFCRNLEMSEIRGRISVAVLESNPEDYRLFSMYDDFYIYSKPYDDRDELSVNSLKLYEDEALAAKHYDILFNMYNIMPKKKMDYEPMLYPWYSSSIRKTTLLLCMLNAACVMEDDEKIDFISTHLTDIDTDRRSCALKIIAARMKTPVQRAAVINAVADRETYTRKRAVELLSEMKLADEDYVALEKFAKYKTADLREGVIELIKKRGEKGINESILRMIKSKDENVRLAALDLLKYAISKYKDCDFSEAKAAVSALENPSEREEILINEIVGNSDTSEVTKENGYGLYDPLAELEPVEFNNDISVVRDYFSVEKEDITEMYLALMKVIDDNAQREYTDSRGEEHLLGNFMEPFYWLSWRRGDDLKPHEYIPCHELWAGFYRDTVKTPQRFWALYLQANNATHLYYNKQSTKESHETYERNLRNIFGNIADYDYQSELVQKDERFDNSNFKSMRFDVFESIISEFDLKIPLNILQQTVAYLARELDDSELWLDYEKKDGAFSRWEDKKYSFITSRMVNCLFSSLKSHIDEDFETNFKLLHELAVKNKALEHYENDDIYHDRCISDVNMAGVYYVKAHMRGIINDDVFYKTMFEVFGVENAVSDMSPFMSGATFKYRSNEFNNVLADEDMELDENYALPVDSELYKVGNALASRLIDKILDVELKRGDSETVFSKSILKISCIFGIDRLMEILKAFGNDTISRTSYWYGNKISKKDSLSHLLSVCYPAEFDNAEKLGECMKNSKIKDDRLIEVAMYAPQWIDIVEEYFKIDGMKSGCYYFMAHTADSISSQRQAIIAKYTPLTKEELNGGCFDVKWFNEAYNTLGDKMFNKLYKSAKYISSSNMHTRARRYADAALGKMDIAETEATIEDKRNKDLLMSLAIIPSKGRADILQRYEFIQKFLKESKQFGAQRRASESSAVQYALKNLAVTAGYSDETRLTLSMETELVQNNKKYFSQNSVGEYDVTIEVDRSGKAALKIEKGGKVLKSVPAAIKKNTSFLEIKEFCDKLKQQYSRTVKMFELAMEERDSFSFGELIMLCGNPVTKAIVENLVFVSSEGEFVSGVISENNLVDCDGKSLTPDSGFMLRIAHPYDLYEHKVWAKYQQMFMEIGEKDGIKQPFRQVFRELYVKLPEELEKERSLMFAGNQIQTQRTVGALKNRRWIADYEDGLQKIYYKDDVIAGIYAVADWFSPSDIEAPTLEGVTFVNRRTYKSIKIKDLPDIIYSEVMRDVDLAVSVAHAGGVDPETSHSTVEMRRVILEFNLKLFGISNVTFEKNHAIIEGTHGKYSVHLGSGVIHMLGGRQINVIAVSSGKKSKIFLPFIDEDPKTAEIITKIITFAQDDKIKDPYIMEQIRN